MNRTASLPPLYPPLLEQRVWDVPLAAMPQAGSAYVFLAEAVSEIGKAMHGPLWTGEEIKVPIWTPHPAETKRIHLEARAQAARSAARNAKVRPANEVGGPAAAASPLSALQQWHSPIGGKTFSEEEIREIENRAAERWEKTDATRKRLLDSINWICQQGRDGKLSTFLRPLPPGMAPTPEEPAFWLGEHVVERLFKSCLVTRSTPGQTRVSCYIYVGRDSLNRCKEGLGRASVTIPVEDLAGLSPVLQFAVWFARSNGITSADRQDGEEAMRAEIRAAWSARFQSSPTVSQVNAVYTAVRFPNQQAIERGSRGGRGK